MLTLSSISVGPRPLQTPVANPAPVATGRPSASVGRDSSAAVVNIPSGDGTGVQSTPLPSSLPPVVAPAASASADLPNNAKVLAPRESDAGSAARFKGELPPEPKGPAQEALDRQIEEYIPNLWKASRAAVDALTANSNPEAASPEGPRTEIPVNETPYMLPEGGKPPTSPGTFIDIEV